LRVCLVCNIPIPSKNQKYCSWGCYNKSRIGKPRPQTWRRVKKVCPVCGVTFETGGRKGHRTQIYCSRKCLGISQRKPIENCIRGGRRSAWWRDLRLKVLERDNYRCQLCGRTLPKQMLQAHHIIPTDNGGKHTLENLFTCCKRCHSIINIITNLGYMNNEYFDPFALIKMVRVR